VNPPRLDRFGWIVIVGGVLCAAGGLAVVLAWYSNTLSLVRANASATPIHFNTGVMFVLIGAALVASVIRRNWMVLVGATLAGGFAVITLLEYALHRGLGIDQLLFHTSVADASGTVGRMAPNAALCFLAVSATLVWRTRRPSRASTIATATAAGSVLAVAGAAAAGYALDEAKGYRWGDYTAMALPTTAMFLVVSATLFVLVWRDPQQQTLSADIHKPVGGSSSLRRRSWSVRRVVGLFAVVAFAPLVLLAYLSVTWSSQAVDREARQSVERAATLEAHTVEVWVDNLRAVVGSLAAHPAIVAEVTRAGSGPIDVAAIQALFDEAITTVPGFVSVGLTDPHGILIGTSPVSPGVVGRDFSYRDWYKGVSLTGGSYVSEALQSVGAGHEFVVSIASPIRARIGDPVIGYLAAGYRLTALQSFASGFALDQQISLTITDQRGVVVASPNQAAGLVSRAADKPVRLALAGNTGALSQTGSNGRELVGYAPVGDIGWTVTARFPASGGPLDQIVQLRVAVLALTLILLAALTVALVFLARGWRARTVAEGDLDRVAIELRRSNDDLQQFAHAASHDLSEPLRAISGPISLLARRYRGQLDPEADQLIDFSVDGCQRMQQLIDGLLTYSRVGQLESAMRPVDCNLIMNSVMAALGPAIEDAGATVHIGPLPIVTAEANQLGQVLQNLITNALKFMRPGAAPIVSVQADRVESEWCFSVTDNGIGIAQEHRDRIFGMFKRLHSREQYPGTGIGLALAKKIVERHGGRIGVEDGPSGIGSRFWFTLPAEKA
jgi:signal transduction histidine kinase